MIRLKTTEEIKRIRASCRLLAETYSALIKIIEENITTEELDKFAYDFIKRHGGTPAFLNYQGYPASLCTSVNQVVIHGIPGKQKLKQGDIISLDLGINLKGYYSDAALTFPVGKITKEAENLLSVTREALYLGIEKAVAGNRIKDISGAVYSHAKNHNYGVVREYCGHGVGFNVHEDPQIPNYIGPGPNPRLKPRMVLAIEPMINLGTDDVVILEDSWSVITADNSISAHFEHTVAIFEDHTEILTLTDQNLI